MTKKTTTKKKKPSLQREFAAWEKAERKRPERERAPWDYTTSIGEVELAYCVGWLRLAVRGLLERRPSLAKADKDTLFYVLHHLAFLARHVHYEEFDAGAGSWPSDKDYR